MSESPRRELQPTSGDILREARRLAQVRRLKEPPRVQETNVRYLAPRNDDHDPKEAA